MTAQAGLDEANTLPRIEPVRSASLIFNPNSGARPPAEDLKVILEFLAAAAIDVKVFECAESPGQSAREAVQTGPDIVLVAGGDGTVGAVASTLAHQPIPLGILPCGTANALAMALGIPRDLRKACEVVLTARPRVIDLARCNGRISSLLVAIGFEAKVVKELTAETKETWGPLAYYVEAFAQLPKRELFEAEIASDDGTVIMKAAAVTIANAAPPSSPLAQGCGEVVFDDGMLDVTIAGPETMMQTVETLAELVMAIVTRRPVESEFLKAIRTRRVKVNARPGQPVVLDGEDIGSTPIAAECLPRALTVLVPPSVDT